MHAGHTNVLPHPPFCLSTAGYTRPGLVALEAHSAGGLAAGGLLNRRPADIGAALLEAPFVDVLSAMSRPELPLTVAEFEEWGDPAAGAEAFEQVQLGWNGRLSAGCSRCVGPPRLDSVSSCAPHPLPNCRCAGSAPIRACAQPATRPPC